MNNNAIITQRQYCTISEWSSSKLNISGTRTMDSITKVIIHTAMCLKEKLEYEDLNRERIGIVIGTRGGAVSSISALRNSTEDRGYIGINPSLFPNIMMSTSLSRAATALQIRGPSSVMYYTKENGPKSVIQYAYTQIGRGRADGMYVIFAEENRNSLGLFIQG